MKKFLSYSLLAAAAATGMSIADTATTTPVGYTTNTLTPAKYNLIGLTLHQAKLISGSLTASQSTAGVLNATATDFSGIVTTDSYVVEITSGASEGIIFEVPGSSFNDATDTITVGGAINTAPYASLNFSVRKSATISGIFGAANEAGLLGGASANVSDTILLPNTTGGFDEYYYSTGGFFGTGWRRSGAGSNNQAGVPVSFIDGLYVYRRGATSLSIVVSGEVKLTKTSLPVTTGYGTYSSVYPVGTTLGNSGIQNSLTQGASAGVADTVLIPTANGFDEYYYSNGGFFGTGWRKSGAGSADQSSIELPSGYLIQRRGAATNVAVSVPAYGL